MNRERAFLLAATAAYRVGYLLGYHDVDVLTLPAAVWGDVAYYRLRKEIHLEDELPAELLTFGPMAAPPPFDDPVDRELVDVLHVIHVGATRTGTSEREAGLPAAVDISAVISVPRLTAAERDVLDSWLRETFGHLSG